MIVDTAADSTSWQYLLQAWAGDLGKLSAQAQSALLVSVPEVHNLVFKDQARLSGRCAEYCSQLAHRLHQQGIEVRMIGGLYLDEIIPGTTVEDLERMVARGDETDEIFDWGSHTWLEIEDQLIDPTAGQFFQNSAAEWNQQFYLPTQVKMHSFLEAWDRPGLHLGGRVVYGSNGQRQKM